MALLRQYVNGQLAWVDQMSGAVVDDRDLPAPTQYSSGMILTAEDITNQAQHMTAHPTITGAVYEVNQGAYIVSPKISGPAAAVVAAQLNPLDAAARIVVDYRTLPLNNYSPPAAAPAAPVAGAAAAIGLLWLLGGL